MWYPSVGFQGREWGQIAREDRLHGLNALSSHIDCSVQQARASSQRAEGGSVIRQFKFFGRLALHKVHIV